ncbi:hypothetical protein D3C78_1133300 [compost metagenome]
MVAKGERCTNGKGNHQYFVLWRHIGHQAEHRQYVSRSREQTCRAHRRKPQYSGHFLYGL